MALGMNLYSEEPDQRSAWKGCSVAGSGPLGFIPRRLAAADEKPVNAAEANAVVVHVLRLVVCGIYPALATSLSERTQELKRRPLGIVVEFVHGSSIQRLSSLRSRSPTGVAQL